MLVREIVQMICISRMCLDFVVRASAT